jgi:septum formation protein
VCDLEEKSEKTAPCELVMDLAKVKALAIMDKHEGEDVIVLGADTVVANGDKILGKPRDLEQAKEMISSLQGKTHQVYTGVCLWWNDGKLKQHLRIILPLHYLRLLILINPM